jgi:hypothetical protein
MDRALEKQLAAKAVGLGNAAAGTALPDLVRLLGMPSPEVRRLAASAIGKLAGLADSALAVAALVPRLRDPHPQVRQYAIKALKAYGRAAEPARHDLADIAANPAEKEYNRRDAQLAVEVVTEALRIAEQQAVHVCQKCSCTVAADEYARSQKAFQRTYCDHCFDEVFLSRRNWETQVELNKTIQAADGTVVQSDGERLVAEALGLTYRYDNRFRIIKGYAIRPDFYLPELDVYIEYWGLEGNLDYQIGMLEKLKLYQQAGKRLISLHPADKPRLAEVLRARLAAHTRVPAVPPGATDSAAAP